MRETQSRGTGKASVQRSRAQVQQLIEHEYTVVGVRPTHPTADLAVISLALFNGLGIDRLVNPTAVTDWTLDTTPAFLFEAMGVDNTTEARESPH